MEQYLNILLDGYTEGNDNIENRMVNRSLSRIRDMRKTIFDILDLPRVESGQRARELVMIDLKEAAKRPSLLMCQCPRSPKPRFRRGLDRVLTLHNTNK